MKDEVNESKPKIIIIKRKKERKSIPFELEKREKRNQHHKKQDTNTSKEHIFLNRKER